MAKESKGPMLDFHCILFEDSLPHFNESSLSDVYEKLKTTSLFLSLHAATDTFPTHLHLVISASDGSKHGRYKAIYDRVKQRYKFDDDEKIKAFREYLKKGCDKVPESPKTHSLLLNK